MPRRSGKFYRKNEAEVMLRLGLQPTKNSGAGWVEKEDGQSEHLIAQLKSTDNASISIKLKDIEVLEENATIAHKVPIFVIQFLSTGKLMVMSRPEDIGLVAEYIQTGDITRPSVETIIEVDDIPKEKPKPSVKSSSTSREDFWEGKRKEASKWKKKL